MTGWLFLTFEDPTLRLSPRKLTQLGTFAQFCLLMQERLHVMEVLEDREHLLRQTERLANIGSWYDDVENDQITITPQTAAIFEQDENFKSIN